jgi:hypothetical protein
MKPQLVRVQDIDGNAEPEVAAEIELGEFQRARQDPAWQSFRDEALAYQQHLREEDRSS